MKTILLFIFITALFSLGGFVTLSVVQRTDNIKLYTANFRNVALDKKLPDSIYCSMAHIYDRYIECSSTNLTVRIDGSTGLVDYAVLEPKDVVLGDYIIEHGNPDKFHQEGVFKYLSWKDGITAIINEKIFSPKNKIFKFVLWKRPTSSYIDETWKGFVN